MLKRSLGLLSTAVVTASMLFGVSGQSAYADSLSEEKNMYQVAAKESAECKKQGQYKVCETPEQAKKWGEKQYNKWKPNKNEQTVLNSYTKYAGKFNTPLRDNKGDLTKIKDQNTRNNIVALDGVLKKGEIPEDIILFRGDDPIAFMDDPNKLIKNGKIDKEEFNKLKEKYKGKSKTEYGYISTSLLSNTPIFSTKVFQIEFKTLAGTHGGYIEKHSSYPGQYEFLLPRNTTYIISKMELSNDEKHIKIEALVKR
ncbi:ADP-ribosyltransferase [Bacillus mycoides]|uniref:ADP ribosyltransferase domain-containing protein n=1 Tax=Bacillus mycoides TaxID=1405 RepID=A0A4U3AAL0_BACMY|nr:ADP-ribosyltransferase [Bacillus mycoides]TKI83990.1 hypothetical protein FC701_15575 [Bacillus mycoides]